MYWMWYIICNNILHRNTIACAIFDHIFKWSYPEGNPEWKNGPIRLAWSRKKQIDLKCILIWRNTKTNILNIVHIHVVATICSAAKINFLKSLWNYSNTPSLKCTKLKIPTITVFLDKTAAKYKEINLHNCEQTVKIQRFYHSKKLSFRNGCDKLLNVVN